MFCLCSDLTQLMLICSFCIHFTRTRHKHTHRTRISKHKWMHTAMFEQVIEHFGFKFQLNRFYSRCTLCNGGFERIAVSEARELDQCPDGLRSGTDENGFSVKFVRCVSSECGQLYWWGGKAAQAASAYRDIFIKVEKKKREMMREMAKQMQGGKSGGGTDGKVEGRSNANFSGNGKEKKSNSNNGARECNDDNSNSRHIDRNPVVKTGVEDEEGDGKDDGDYDAYNDFDDVEDLWAEKGGRDRVHTQWNLNKERGANEHMQNTSVVSTHPGIGSGNSHTTFRAVDDADTVTHAEDNDYITHLSKTLSDVEISTSISSSSSSSFSSSSSVPSSSLLSSDPSLDASTALPALSKTMASLATTSSEIYTGGIR